MRRMIGRAAGVIGLGAAIFLTSCSPSAEAPAKPKTEDGKRFSPLLEGQPERTINPKDDPRPIARGKVGVGSYEDPGEQKRKGRTKGKTGRPGR